MNVKNDFFKWTQFPKLVWHDFIRRKGSVTLLAVLILLLIPVGLWLFKNNEHCQNVLRHIFDIGHLDNVIQNEWYQLFLLTAFLTLAISICVTLTNIYSLKKKEAAITLCQILILVFVGFWIFGLFPYSNFRMTLPLRLTLVVLVHYWLGYSKILLKVLSHLCISD